MDDTELFKKEREEKFGGQIRFMSYARYIGEARGGKLLNKGGILYIIGDMIHFEDFESHNGLMAMMGQKKKYSKTEFSLDLENIAIIKDIREKQANECVEGFIDEQTIPPAPRGIASLLIKNVMQIIINGGPSLFLDFLDKEGFLAIVNEYMMRPE